MTEFKQISIAPKYEIDREGYIQTIDKQTPIFPYPLGSKQVKLKVDGGERKSFNVDELISSVFDIKVKRQEVVGEKSVPSKNAPAETPAKINAEREAVAATPDAKKIMKLDTFMSVKIWKLHQAGLSNSEISDIVKYPHSANVQTTIENYKKSEKQRVKADKVKV